MLSFYSPIMHSASIHKYIDGGNKKSNEKTHRQRFVVRSSEG